MKIGKGFAKNFSKKMREQMYRKNLKQVDIVERTGIPSSAVTMYYNGKYLPKSKNLKLIAKVLDVSESYLLDYEENDNTNNNTNEEKILAMYRNLSDDNKDKLYKYLLKLYQM